MSVMMGMAGLSLHQAPPLSVPMRFFLTAPLFALAGCLLMLVTGPEILLDRWLPETMALTHLITLGFISMVMIGAVQQLLPVLVGSPVKRPLLFSWILHLLIVLGVLLLAGGFVSGLLPLFHAGFAALTACFGLFVVVTLYCLFTAESKSDSVTAMRLSVIALAIAVMIGICTGSGHVADYASLAHVAWTDVHLGWALLGWVGLMFIGVGYQVVPMFQLTPAYPKAVKRWLAPVIFALLLLYSASQIWLPVLAAPLLILLLAGFVVFAVVTRRLQRQRRRRIPDVTLDYWKLGMVSIFLAAALWIVRLPLSGHALAMNLELAIGITVLIGVIGSLVIGMIYKIVPFLLWFHLQSQLDEYVRLPSMKEMLPEKPTRRQLYLHVAALAMLLATAALPTAWLFYPAVLLFAVSNVMLGLNLLAALRYYQRQCIMLAGMGDEG